MELNGFVKNGGLLADRAQSMANTAGQLTPYFAAGTREFLQQNAQYASNFFEAEIAGIDEERPEEKRWYRIRVADVRKGAVSGANLIDGWKSIYFEDPRVEVLPRGAKLWFGGSVWLCVNPGNIGSVAAGGIVRRCDAVWGMLDYYGKRIYEPFVLNRQATKANENIYLEHDVLPDNYLDCIMSADEIGRTLRENTRMVLGSTAYKVTGLNDFARERTEDPESVKVLTFSLYRSQPTKNDDLKYGIADAGAFSWEVHISGPESLPVGHSARLRASSLRCGEPPEREASYLWESFDPSVLTVDESGLVTAVAPGCASIACRLEQNPEIAVTVSLKAVDGGEAEIFWEQAPDQLSQYASAAFSAGLWHGGKQIVEPINFRFDGPPKRCYEAAVDGNRVVLTCYYPSDIPLAVTAEGGGEQTQLHIRLTGY